MVMRIVTSLLIIVAVTSSIVFAVLNSHLVDINYYLGETQAPLSLVLAMTLMLGVVVGISPCVNIIVKIKRENARLNKRIKLTEEEVVNLRNIPIKDNS
jgi:putative membrane protein